MKKGKKIALFVTMVLILAAAAVLNVTLLAANSNNNDGDNLTPTGSFFATSRADRLAVREYELERVNEIIALEGDEYAAARQTAIAQKQAIVDAMELELLLETLLKAQGFEDVLVSVSTTSDLITIIVDKDELTYQDTVRIYSVIEEQTSVSTDYVNFMAI